MPRRKRPAPVTVPLAHLPPGARFRAPYSGLVGRVERVGEAGVAVRLEREAVVEVGGRTFTRPERAILACSTAVLHLTEDGTT